MTYKQGAEHSWQREYCVEDPEVGKKASELKQIRGSGHNPERGKEGRVPTGPYSLGYNSS